MTKNNYNKIAKHFTYNNIGLVDSIVFDNGAKVEYTYGLNGEKLKVSHITEQSSAASARSLVSAGPLVPTVPGIRTNVVRTTEYLGGDVELEGESWIYGKTYKYYFGDGYVQFYPGSSQAPRYYFYSKDHLGNVRSVVTKNPTTNEIAEVQQTHYYPFGGIIADLSTGRSVQNKLYNGKELDTSNNLWWYDYGARQYDPTAPRFTTPDRFAEKYYSMNMYGYCGNNPVKYIDIKGDSIKFRNGVSEEFKQKYNETREFLIENGCGQIIENLEKDELIIVYIDEAKDYNNSVFRPNENCVLWNPTIGITMETDGKRVFLSPATILIHELDHATAFNYDLDGYNERKSTLDPIWSNMEEKRVITGSETDTAQKLGEIDKNKITRDSHGAAIFRAVSPISNKRKIKQ